MEENVYIGIDIGKQSHTAAFLSRELLARHKRFRACPTLKIENSQAGFEKLLQVIHTNTTTTNVTVLIEHCGHYGATLIQFLQQHGIHMYHMHVSKRHSWDKTDERDAQSLAMLAYNTLEMHVPSDARILPLIPPSATVQRLRALVDRREELVEATTQRKNQLIAILDEIFPELTQVYKNPNALNALALRENYPTPQVVAEASLEQLAATRTGHFPTRVQLSRLQTLAASSIGTRDPHRLFGLVIEQKQLIAELRLFMEHMNQLEREIIALIEESREGLILMSMGVGPIQSAILIAGIGSIANFESDAALRRYLGWAPVRSQTGTTLDKAQLKKSGNGRLKQTVYLIVINAIRRGKWKVLYDRLVERKCNYDERKGKYTGKMKVVGRIAGQFIRVMYVLLRRDHTLTLSVKDGQELPAPILYDEQLHRIVKK